MVFLNPAVLIGMLAAAIPVIIHLLNLKRLKKVEFSTLAFLKELRKSKIRKIRLKQWLLLAIRMLIIAFLVMAFARPTIKSISFGNSAAKTSAYFIIDNSYSMSVIDEKGAYFNQAKVIAGKLIDNLQEGDEISVVFTSGLNGNAVKPSQDFSAVKKIIKQSEISDITSQHSPGLMKVFEELENSMNFNKEIYYISDFQKINYLKLNKNNKQKFETLPESRFYEIRFNPKNVTNLTVTDFKSDNQIFEFNKPVEFTVTVKNNSAQNINNATITLFINGKRRAHAGVKLAAGESKSYKLTTTLKEKGLLEISTELDDDDILRDNKMYLGIYVPEKIKVLLITGKNSGAKFPSLALKPEIAGAISLEKISKEQIASRNLKNYDVIFVLGALTVNTGVLKDYLLNGGNLIFMPASNDELSKVRNFCKKLNLPLPEQINNFPDNPVVFEKIDLKHPVFANLFRKNFNPELDSPLIYKYLQMNTQGKGKSIISLIDNSSFLSEYNLGKGKIMFFSVAPGLEWSDFPLKGIFAPLMNKLVYYLTSSNQKINVIRTGDKIDLSLRNVSLPQIKVVKPGGEEFIELDLKKAGKFYTYSKTGKSGIYKFYSGKKLIDYYAVNFNPAESDLSVLSETEFENVLKTLNYPGKVINLKPEENFKKIIYQSRFGTELWRYFLIIALVLALLEMFVSKSAKKDLENI